MRACISPARATCASNSAPCRWSACTSMTAQRTAMERMGFRQLRDLLRLPRKALTRRFGPALPDYLERLLGIRPDPRTLYQPPESFSSRLELPAEIHTLPGPAVSAETLAGRTLRRAARRRYRGAGAAYRMLGHEDHGDSLMEPGLQSPTQDPARLMTVLRERLERLRLPQAVREIRLEAPQLLKFNAGPAHPVPRHAGGAAAGHRATGRTAAGPPGPRVGCRPDRRRRPPAGIQLAPTRAG